MEYASSVVCQGGGWCGGLEAEGELYANMRLRVGVDEVLWKMMPRPVVSGSTG